MPSTQPAPPSPHVTAPKVELDVAGLSDVGLEREHNEDQFLIATLQRNLEIHDTTIPPESRHWLPSSSEGNLLMVADGMGGTDGGEIASSVAVRAIADYVCNVLPWVDASARSSDAPRNTLPGVRTGLHSALVQGDNEVRRAAAQAGGSDMGTTVTVAYLMWPMLYVAHVGDSRCYVLRGGALEQLTTDHTLATRIREKAGIDIDDSSPWHHILWNALGGGEGAEIEPEVHSHVLQGSDMLLLCSDGLTKHASDAEIANTLMAAPSAAEACRRLVAMAIADGGTDNVTVVIARRAGGGDLRAVDSEAPTRVRPRPPGVGRPKGGA
jgi:protein phosphatase